jgi:4-hydroxythreonine-4-phosphate dehydrogenase
MPEVLILADDLSGAADCAGGCAAAGLNTLVLLAPELAARATVIAIDLDTRESSAGEAASQWLTRSSACGMPASK